MRPRIWRLWRGDGVATYTLFWRWCAGVSIFAACPAPAWASAQVLTLDMHVIFLTSRYVHALGQETVLYSTYCTVWQYCTDVVEQVQYYIMFIENKTLSGNRGWFWIMISTILGGHYFGFILLLSFTERFRDSNNNRIAQHNHNSGQRTITTKQHIHQTLQPFNSTSRPWALRHYDHRF